MRKKFGVRRLNSLKRAVVGELQFQPEIGCAEHLDNFLKQVAALGADAHEITLDRSLDFDLAVLDLLHYLSTLFDRYTGLNRNLLPRGSAGGRSNGAIRKVFERRSEEHTSELQSRLHLVCRLLLEKKKKKK